MVACFEVGFREALADPALAVIFRNEVGHSIFTPTSELAPGGTGRFAAGERIRVRMRFVNR